MLPKRYFEPTDRFDGIVFGLFLLAVAGFLGSFGIKGAIGYLHGSRAAPSDPVACAVGILGGLGAGYVSLRLLTGWRSDRPLLSNLILFCGGIGALAGAAWYVLLTKQLNEPLWNAIRPASVAGAIGVGALALWWRRVRAS
jgi:hypothetical protein